MMAFIDMAVRKLKHTFQISQQVGDKVMTIPICLSSFLPSFL